MDETASFWIKRAVSFKSCKTPKRVNLQSSPQLSFVPLIASLPNSNPVPIFGRVFHFGPWPLNYAIEPLIDQ
jgi:hypothetical protein